MEKIAVVGTVGVPANYGGFETLVENIIGENCSSDIEYTVFCSSVGEPKKLTSYKGAKLKYLPLNANGIQSIFYDIISMIRCLVGYDVVLVLGVSGCIFLPVFRLFNRKRLIVNIDGLEWKRNKWGKYTKKFLKLSESVAVHFADVVVADNKAIVDYVSQQYNKRATLIAYGADHIQIDVTDSERCAVLDEYGLKANDYSLAICRIEPENNTEMILEAFAATGRNLVYVGNWNRSKFSRDMMEKYGSLANITIIDSLYDVRKLFVLRSCCKWYIHGHSAGGTNPSLVEAMYNKCNILAFDVVYNRETTENKAAYFKSKEDLVKHLSCGDDTASGNASVMAEIAQRRYTWSVVAKEYEAQYKAKK